MTAFEQAWNVVKAPLDPSSIRHRKPEMGLRRTTADFVHPRDPEIRYPMELESDSDEHEGEVRVYDEGRKQIGTASVGGVDWGDSRSQRLEEIARMRVGDEPVADDPKTWFGLDSHEDAIEDYDEARREIIDLYGYRFPATDVDSPYQRLGIGTAMYDFMTALGMDVSPDVIQSYPAQRMWEKNQGKRLPEDYEPDFTDVSWKPSNQEIAEWVDPTLNNMRMTDFGVKVR
jgi:GNAT superfamily N-acetyltransferase|tara:strand:- start:45 stop:734 length:690 start_codon:yes stop_codon:yes gene_type:complete